jgi:oligopeptide transport system permease protein
MTAYLFRRFLWMIPVLFFVAFITFILMHSAPGGPWDRDLNAKQIDARTQELLNERFGLDKPLFINTSGGNLFDSQFFRYIGGILHGDLGPSYRQRGLTVQQILFQPPRGKSFWQSRFGYSARLGMLSLSWAVILGIPFGIVAALNRNSILDYFALFISTIGVSVPSFVLAIFLLILLATKLHLINIVQQEWSSPSAWITPALILGFGTFAYITRLTRSSMLEVIRQDYVRTARAKGLHETAIIRVHMLRNAMIPVFTVIGPALAGLVIGSFIIESMFGFPGSGRAYVQAVSNRDYSMIMGTTLLYALLVVLGNLMVDISYLLLDPRIET